MVFFPCFNLSDRSKNNAFGANANATKLYELPIDRQRRGRGAKTKKDSQTAVHESQYQ
jgi:hypothetical protein